MQVIECQQTFWYTPPALRTKQRATILKKYHDKTEIHRIRAPLMKELDSVDEEIETTPADLREMILDDYQDRFSTEWVLMCLCANPGQRSTDDSICGEDFTGRPINELLDQFIDIQSIYPKLDREYCYRWLVKFDKPPRMAEIELELVLEFGRYSDNITLPFVRKLKKPCLPNEVYRNKYSILAVVFFYKFFVSNQKNTGVLDNIETKKIAFYDEIFKGLRLALGPKAFEYSSSESESDHHSEPDQNLSESGQNLSEPGNNRSEAGNNRSEAGNNRSEAGNNRSEPGNNRSEPGNNRSEPGNNRAEPGNNRSEPGNNRSEAGNNRSEAGHHRSEAGHHRSEPGHHRLEAGHHRSELGQHRSELGQHRSEPGQHHSEPGHHHSEPGRHHSEPEHHQSESDHQILNH